MAWKEWKEYLINVIKNPSLTIDFVNQKYSHLKMGLLIIIAGLFFIPNFLFFYFSAADLWIWIAFPAGLIAILLLVFTVYQIIFFVLSKIMYRNTDHPFSVIRKSNIWYAATSYIIINLIFMPIQLVLYVIGERGVGLWFFWIITIVWYIHAMALEFQAIQYYIKANSLKNMYLTILSHICGFGILQILLYLGFLVMY